MKFNWFYLIWSFAFLGVIALVVLAGAVEPEIKASIFKEGGWVETLSAAGYFVGLAYFGQAPIFSRMEPLRDATQLWPARTGL